jgi:serine/threonine protein kinase
VAESHIHALPAGFEFEGYRIERMLGSGGFGITYKATETLIRRSVAIKEYLPSSVAAREVNSSTVRPLGEADAEIFRWGLKRFRNEARTLVAFHHPNIVAVYRFFEANGTAYLVMAFEEGMSLAAILKEAKTLTESEIHEFLDPLLDGVAEVHKAGFLHRDIKPANIMIRRDGTPSLIDFGAARLALGGKTESASKAVVSPGYAPFEQYSSTIEQGPYTDIYALGATVYACIAGERPPEALDRVAGQSMASALNTGRGNYSEPLLRAVDHALAIKPEDRPQTVAQWRAELASAEEPAAEAPSGNATQPPQRQIRTEPPRPMSVQKPPRTQPPPAARPPARTRILKIAALIALTLAGSAGAFAGVRYYIEMERARAAEEERVRKEKERVERERREAEERERREAEKRRPAEAAAAKAREAQRTAVASYRTALADKQKAIQAADCGRKAADRGRRKDAGYYSGKLTNGNQYEGQLNSAQRPDGCGVLVETGGARFEGHFKDGIVHGYTVNVFPDGKRYEGSYENGKAHGYGIIRLANGTEAFGVFRDSYFVGPGVWTQANGVRYEGEFVNGRWHGYGVWSHSDGRVYEGEFADGLWHGAGILTGSDGKKTYGRWVKGEAKGD